MKQSVRAFPLRGGLLLSTFCLLSPALARQDSPSFRHLSLEHGLSQSSVFCILQDRTGYLWFGTADGLNRYDGYGFTLFRHSVADSHSLSENTITALCEDSLGALWIGSMAAGVNRHIPGSRRFTRFAPDSSTPATQRDGRIRALCTDPYGRVWVGTQQGNLYAIDPQTSDSYTPALAPDESTFPAGHAVRAILSDSGGLWIGTDGAGLWRLEWKNEGRLSNRFRGPQETGIPSGVCTKIEELFTDQSGDLWVGTFDAGVYRLSVQDGRCTNLLHFSSQPDNPGSITGDVVQAFCEDPSGDLWIGTWEGLNRLSSGSGNQGRNQVQRVLHSATDPGSLASNTVHAILVDRSGVMWVGTRGGGVSYRETAAPKFRLYKHDPFRSVDFPPGPVRAIVTEPAGFWVGTTGGGIAHINHATGAIITLRHDPGHSASLSSDDVRTLAFDRDGVLWVGTYGGGLNRVARSHGHRPVRPIRFDMGVDGGRHVFAFLQDSRGTYWVGTQEGLLHFLSVDRSGRKPVGTRHFRHDAQDSSRISHRIVRMLFEDSRGTIWVGTYGGLNRIDPPSDRVRTYRMIPGKPGTISHAVVVAACEDTAGFVWFGTMGGGLNRYDPRTDTFTVIDERSGLPNAYVYGVLADREQNLWLSSNLGLTRFTAARWHPRMDADSTAQFFRTYSMTDGLQSMEFNAGAACADATGELYFGGIGGLNRFFPAEVRDIPFEPTVVMSGFQIFARKIDLDSALALSGVLRLTHGQNHFSFEAASLDFAHPENNKYAFLLEGFDHEWRDAGTRRYAAYTNLGHGDYTVRVRGTNRDGVWSGREAALRLTIAPPYWHAWWFRAGAAMAILAGIAAVVTLRRKALRKEWATRQRFLQQLIESQEGERKRIAAELHDSLGQNLLLIKNRALLGLGDSSGTREQLQEISDLASRTIGEVREISYGLRPYQLDRLGLTKALRGACRQVEQSTQIALFVAIENIDSLVPPELAINIYRIVQEGLSNIVKYAQATTAGVDIRRAGRKLIIQISDNGRGFPASSPSAESGFGLTGIRERAQILSGTAEIVSSPGAGTRVTVVIPIPEGAT